MSGRRRAALALVSLVVVSSGASAEFHAWTDAAGQRRISNLPPEGVRGDGGVRDGYHPLSVRAQHARLRARLAQQGAEIAAADAAAADVTRPAGAVEPFTLDLFDDILRRSR